MNLNRLETSNPPQTPTIIAQVHHDLGSKTVIAAISVMIMARLAEETKSHPYISAIRDITGYFLRLHPNASMITKPENIKYNDMITIIVDARSTPILSGQESSIIPYRPAKKSNAAT